MTTARPETTSQPSQPDFDHKAFSQFEHDGWERTARGWHHHFHNVSTQAVGALLDAVEIGATRSNQGRRVLDVATGPGYAAGEAARRGAEAHGLDFSSAQVALAQQQFPGAAFDVGDAESLPFDNDHFDAVVMNFGLQHFTVPERALLEAYRVLRPGGRIGFTVWAKPPESAGFHIVQQAITVHGNPDAPIPAGPAYYRFSNVAESVRTLLWAGFKAPRVTDVPQTWRVPDADAILAAVGEGTVRAGALLRAQADEARVRIDCHVREAAEAYREGDTIALPMPAVLASATKLV